MVTRFLSLAVVISLLLPHSALATTVGYQDRTFPIGEPEESIAVSLWYPASGGQSGFDYGPFALDAAPNAPPQEGIFPLIVLSHGTQGSRLNHHGLAHLLAQGGFIVAAVDHPGDYWQDSRYAGTLENWSRRPRQLSQMLDQLLVDPLFGALIDHRKIGAVGHSAGGYSVLALAGASPDIGLIVAHCRDNRALDPQFCGYGKPGGTMPDSPSPLLKDSRFSAIVAVAPIGVMFSGSAMKDVSADIMLIRLGNDDILRYPYHAENIATLLGSRLSDYTLEPDAHHFAFIEPFPDSIKAGVGLPALDPPGFDRRSFLGRVNPRIVKFLIRAMALE